MNVDEWMKSANSLSPNDMEAGECFFCVDAFIAFITVIKSMDCQLSKINPARSEGLHLKLLELGGVCKKMSTWLQRWQLSNRNFSQSCKLHDCTCIAIPG